MRSIKCQKDSRVGLSMKSKSTPWKIKKNKQYLEVIQNSQSDDYQFLSFSSHKIPQKTKKTKQNRSFSQCTSKAKIFAKSTAENDDTDWVSDTSPKVRMNIPLPTSTWSDRLIKVKNTLNFIGNDEDISSYKLSGFLIL